MSKCYSELILLNNYEDRLEYLKTRSKVGYETFASKRILNQQFYKSDEYKNLVYEDNAKTYARKKEKEV